MKIRQKIAMLLAAAMTVTAVPMMTMAKSDFSLTKGIQVTEADKPVSTQLKVDMKDAVTTDAVMFFVDITNAKFKGATGAAIIDPASTALTAGKVTYIAAVDSKQMQVTIAPNAGQGLFYLPLDVEIASGDATVAVDGVGSVISHMAPVVFARTTDSKANVTVGDAKTLYVEESAVADITIQETVKGSLGTKEIKLMLQTDDYEFILTTPPTITLERGYNSSIISYNALSFEATKDAQVIKFSLNAPTGTVLAPGRVVIKGLKVKATTKSPATGELKIKVSGDNVNEAVVKVADIKEYGMTLKMKDEKVVEMAAGTAKDITFEVKENVRDVLTGGREIEVSLEKGYFAAKKTDANTEADIKTLIASKIKTPAEKMDTPTVNSLTLKDDWVTGFTIKLGNVDGNEISSFKFEDLKVYMPLGVTGDVKITMSGRAIGNDLEVVAANVKAPVTVESSPVTLKVGLKDQVGGKIVITETDKGMLKSGEWLTITLDKDASVEIADKGTLTVTSGDLKTQDFEVTTTTSGILRFKVKRASTVASTIEIKDMKFTVNRTVPQGTYNAKINGDAIAKDCNKDSIELKNFLVIGTPNTEDIAANGLKKVAASFVIGSAKYVVNGVETEMDGAVYLENGRTMVPVRYVANALGVNAADIYFAAGTATVIAGNKTVSLKIGNLTALLNGVPVRTMVAAPVIKDGRTYVPVSEIGALLGVASSWDAATQTATFENK